MHGGFEKCYDAWKLQMECDVKHTQIDESL